MLAAGVAIAVFPVSAGSAGLVLVYTVRKVCLDCITADKTDHQNLATSKVLWMFRHTASAQTKTSKQYCVLSYVQQLTNDNS